MYGHRELNPGPLKVQPVFLTTASSLYLHPLSYCSLNYPAVIWVGDTEGNLHQDKTVPEEVINQSAYGVMDLEVLSTFDVCF